MELEHRELWETYWANPTSENVSPLVHVLMPLVHSCLARIAINLPTHVEKEDLLQCAVVGLCNSIERFDVSQDIKFETFAFRRIRGAILDELRNSDFVTRKGRSWLRKVEDAIQEWVAEHGCLPQDSELAESLGLAQDELASLLESAQPWMSLDQTVVSTRGGREVFLKDVIADTTSLSPDQQAEQVDVQKCLFSAFKKLSDREQKILYLYYFEELRLAEIAVLFELTEARICQIHSMILLKLKALVNEFSTGKRK